MRAPTSRSSTSGRTGRESTADHGRRPVGATREAPDKGSNVQPEDVVGGSICPCGGVDLLKPGAKAVSLTGLQLGQGDERDPTLALQVDQRLAPWPFAQSPARGSDKDGNKRAQEERFPAHASITSLPRGVGPGRVADRHVEVGAMPRGWPVERVATRTDNAEAPGPQRNWRLQLAL